MNGRDTAEHIFLSGVKGVLPGKIMNELVSVRKDILRIGYHEYDLQKVRNVVVAGAGKASAAMAHYLEVMLGDRIATGHIITKYGCYCRLKRIKVTEAGHPVPDENSFAGTDELLKIVDDAGSDDLVICIWSGGGSSLLADHPANISPDDIQHLNGLLVRSGADIGEINSVRKHLSQVKGGQLARRIFPARSINIILSDVIGDPLDVIASGPSVPDSTTFNDALKVIDKYDLRADISQRITEYLILGAEGKINETPKAGDPVFDEIITMIAGNNRKALMSASEEAVKLGLTPFIITSEMRGDTGEACRFIVETINSFIDKTDLKKPVCLLFGGETTVKVRGEKPGGRNQHLALEMALAIQNMPGVTFLSAGTDGNDGSTEMAGAVVDSETVHDALSVNADPENYLAEFDAYNFFRNAGGHIFTGPTLTNVMDITVAIIE